MPEQSNEQPTDDQSKDEKRNEEKRDGANQGGEERKAEPTPEHAPELDDKEMQRAEERVAIGAHIIHEVIRKEGEEELERPPSALAWSGLAAGLSMGFSFVAEGLLRSHLPDARWRPLVAKLGYSVGFLIVNLGRQQLFTENTLTPIIPLLARRDRETLGKVARLWVVVLISNFVGALLFAWVAGASEIFDTETRRAMAEIGAEALSFGFGLTFLKGIFAGWLIALLVWLLGSLGENKVAIIVIITYLVGIGAFSHIVVGTVEVGYMVVTGRATVATMIGEFMAPTLLGNILGGVSLVAALNHAQTISGKGEGTSEPA